MAEQAQQQGSGNGKALAVGVGAVVLLLMFGRKGLGGGAGNAPGTGGGSGTTPFPRGTLRTLTIRVAGTSCFVHDGARESPALTARGACEMSRALLAPNPPREVRLYPSRGAQDVVEALKACLVTDGITIAEVEDASDTSVTI